nr:hypothetical protein [Tanacetum cinerariifolium]
SLIISSSKIDSLLDEFASELIFLKSIPSGIDEADCDYEEEILLIKKLLLLPTQPTLCPVINTLLPFSFENEDEVHLLSHRGFKAFQLSSESPMMIYGGNIPTLEVPFLYFYPP